MLEVFFCNVGDGDAVLLREKREDGSAYTVLVDAGRHFLGADADEATLVQTAVRTMGLDDLKPFDPQKKVIEYLLKETI